MTLKSARSPRIAMIIAAGTVMLGGCSSANHTGSSAMMGGDTTYHYSHLTCEAPSPLAGVTVYATLFDMGMTQPMGGTAPMGAHMIMRVAPAAVSGGQVSLVASNMGWRTHELVVMPLTAGATAGRRVSGADGKVDEAGSLGEASSSCAVGAGEGIASGSVGWVTLTLAPGRYELLCNEPNHYRDGMYQELIVN
jgi:uncharacterized cupredoxin-like copper-binding protein